MNILVVNCGSSSLKYQVIDSDTEAVLAKGLCERIGLDGDAIGATGAMAHLARALGKRFAIYNATGVPDYLQWVPLPGDVITTPGDLPFKPGLVVVLDCGDLWRIGRELSAVFANYPSINIDHHLFAQ